MADYLIKPTPSLKSAIPGLKRLGKPKDYFLGTRAPAFDLPRNILIWLEDGLDITENKAFHYRYILSFNLKTPGQAVIDGRIHAYKPDMGVLIFPCQYHHFVVKQARQWIFIGFEMDNPDFFTRLKDRLFETTPIISRALSALLNSYLAESGLQKNQNRTPLHLGLLLNAIALPADNRRPIKSPAGDSGGKETLAARVQRHIFTHRGDGLCIKNIAKTLGLSESRLRARYREELGVSLGRTLKSLRLHQAESLLLSTKKRISEIADICGYGSVYAFSLAFKNRFGVSPLHFRKRL